MYNNIFFLRKKLKGAIAPTIPIVVPSLGPTTAN